MPKVSGWMSPEQAHLADDLEAFLDGGRMMTVAEIVRFSHRDRKTVKKWLDGVKPYRGKLYHIEQVAKVMTDEHI